jgi:predicted HTH domain antitoxin
MMQAIQIEIPQDVVLALKIPQQRIKTTLTEELAVYLYAQGYLSFGKARKLADLTKWEFAERLGARGIPRHYTENDLEEDLRFATDEI